MNLREYLSTLSLFHLNLLYVSLKSYCEEIEDAHFEMNVFNPLIVLGDYCIHTQVPFHQIAYTDLLAFFREEPLREDVIEVFHVVAGLPYEAQQGLHLAAVQMERYMQGSDMQDYYEQLAAMCQLFFMIESDIFNQTNPPTLYDLYAEAKELLGENSTYTRK